MIGFFRRADFWQGVFATLLGTLLGFLLAIGWDLLKDWRTETRERERAMRLVRDEIGTNVALLESIREHLVEDSQLAKEGKLRVDALPMLPTQVWQGTRLAGSFSALVTEFREIEQATIELRS